METLKIEIQSFEDALKGGKVFTDFIKKGDIVTPVNIKSIAFLENGQTSGKTSVMFYIENGNGEKMIAELTKDLLLSATEALKGAIQRFGH